MNGISSSNTPTKRRAWLQFGTRTLLVLTVVVALATWFARREMALEERRAVLLAALEAGDNYFLDDYDAKPSWRQRLGAWLRGKPPTAMIQDVAFDGESFDEADLPLLRDLIEVFPDATVWISVSADKLSPEMGNVLAQVRTVRQLSIWEAPIDPTDETIAWMRKLHLMEGLIFSVDVVDDALLRRLADARVDVGRISDWEEDGDETDWTRVTNEGLRAAASFRKLEELSIGSKANDDGLAAFKDHPALRIVSLAGPGYTDACAETLASLPQLSSLVLTDTSLSDAGIAKAIGNHPLFSLTIKRAVLGEKSIAAISAMTSIEHIDLTDVPLTPELADAIAKQPLDTLTLNCDCTDDTISRLAPVAPELREITLHTPNVTDQGLAWLRGAGKLKDLLLYDTQATAAAMQLVSPASSITCVGLGGPNIDAYALAEVNRSGKLEQILLYGPSIDDDALAVLQPSYESLALCGTRVTRNGLWPLKTGGRNVQVTILFADDTPPPLTEREIERIYSMSKGHVEVRMFSKEPADFQRGLPMYAREWSSESESP